MAGSHSSCMLSFLRNCQTTFQSGSIISHSHYQCMSIPVPSHSCECLVWSGILILVILNYVVLIFHFLRVMMLNIFSYAYLPSIIFLVKRLFKSVTHFSIGLFGFLCTVFWEFFLYALDTSFFIFFLVIRYMIFKGTHAYVNSYILSKFWSYYSTVVWLFIIIDKSNLFFLWLLLRSLLCLLYSAILLYVWS